MSTLSFALIYTSDFLDRPRKLIGAKRRELTHDDDEDSVPRKKGGAQRRTPMDTVEREET